MVKIVLINEGAAHWTFRLADSGPRKQKMTYPNGIVVEGFRIDGIFQTPVKITYPNGTIYVGDYPMGDIPVNGEMTYPDGDIRQSYKGRFQKGQPNGIGTMTYHNDITITDTFINGVPQNHKPPDPKDDKGESKKDNIYSKRFAEYIEVLDTITKKINANQSFSRNEWTRMINRIHTDKLPHDLQQNQAFLNLLKDLNGELDDKEKQFINISLERMNNIRDAFKECTKILVDLLPNN